MGADLPSHAHLIPFAIKLAYTAFIVVLIPVYLEHFGPTNFLFFCDAALLITLVGLWTESSLLLSTAAVGIVVPQSVWIIDFLLRLLGVKFVGLTDYMFRSSLPTYVRLLSLFHAWLPLMLVWLVCKLGYDRWALLAWVAISWLLLLASYFFAAKPPAPANDPERPVNVNYVFGVNSRGVQAWMPAWAWLAVVMAASPLISLPAHLLLERLAGRGPS
jgi:hypothetical protein